jgi:hypothetical protein
MFARKNILSLVIPFLVSQAVGEIQLDITKVGYGCSIVLLMVGMYVSNVLQLPLSL